MGGGGGGGEGGEGEGGREGGSFQGKYVRPAGTTGEE